MKYLVIFAAVLVAGLGYRISISPEWQDAIGTAATMLVKPLIVPLVELINVPAFVYVVSLIIVLAAIAACVAYWLRAVKPRLRQLRSVWGGIMHLPMPSPLSAEGQWQNAMHQLGMLLRRHEVFISAWSEFQTRAVSERGVPNVPFSHFVASEPQQAGRERDGFMLSLPAYFTSLGLIFTFIGLVVALYFAAKGFRSGDMQEARSSIVQLLNAASFKFLTSVAALASAMLISIFSRFCRSLIRRETVSTTEGVESYLSAWRERFGTKGAEGQSATAEVLERIDALLIGVEGLTKAVESLVAQHDMRAPLEARDGVR